MLWVTRGGVQVNTLAEKIERHTAIELVPSAIGAK
jgi:hypothetical protein